MARVPATERREQLIEATIRLMRRKGIQALTLRDVANEAGSGLAAVHYCFGSKEELIHAAVTTWLSSTIGRSEQMHVSEDLRTTVQSLCDGFWSQLVALPHDVLSQLELIALSARGDMTWIGKLIYPVSMEVISAALTESLHIGKESISLEVEELARAIMVIMDGCSLQYISDPGRAEHKELYDFLISALLDKVLVASSAGRTEEAIAP